MAVATAKALAVKPQFIIICAWCDEVLNDLPKTSTLPQTHTICKDCMVKMRQEIAEIQVNKQPVLTS